MVCVVESVVSVVSIVLIVLLAPAAVVAFGTLVAVVFTFGRTGDTVVPSVVYSFGAVSMLVTMEQC